MKNYYYQILTATAIFLTLNFTASAQIVDGVSYVKGKLIEIAVSDCGTYTSGADGVIMPAPDNYHANNYDGSLGYVHDVGGDGWDVGTPTQCGDYVMPGSPEEGFAFQVGNGSVHANVQPWCYHYGAFIADSPAFPGENILNINAGTFRKSVWQGESPETGLAITQSTYYPKNSQGVITIVDICNFTDMDLNEVYYARNVDPDNDAVNYGNFITNNNVKKQYAVDGYSMVSAYSKEGSNCMVAYASVDPRAKASRGNFSMGEPYDMWNGLGGYIQTPGASAGDQAIQISFKIESIPAGGCDCIAWSTYFANTALNADLATLGTACETLGAAGRMGDHDLLEAYANDPENFKKTQFTAYPNPSSGNFTVNMFDIEDATITVKNAIGQVVYNSSGESKVTGVYLEGITPGIYFITVTHQGVSLTKSIVIE